MNVAQSLHAWYRPLAQKQTAGYIARMRLLLSNLPASLVGQRDCLASCLEAMNSVMPLRAVYLFR